METIRKISKLRATFGRQRNLIMGLLVMFHPLNTGYYLDFIQQLIDLEIDYLYINPILPYPELYGLKINPAVEEKMASEFAQIRQKFAKAPITIRFPDNVFKKSGSKYFDPSHRHYPTECLITRLQPNIGPIYNQPGRGKITACILHPLVTGNQEFYYTDRLGEESFESVWNQENFQHIQLRASHCIQCISQKSITALDWMLYVRRNFPGAEFLLLFPESDAQSKMINHSETVGIEEKLSTE